MCELFSHIRLLMLGKKSVRGNSGVPDGEGLIDQSSYDVIEVDNLLDVIDHSKTLVGKNILHKTFAQQCLTPEEIIDKQEALKELAENGLLREDVKQIIETAVKYEDSFYRMLFSNFVGLIFAPDPEQLEEAGYGYSLFSKAIKFIPSVVHKAEKTAQAKSCYLKGLLTEIKEFSTTRDYKLMQGPVYVLMKELLLKEEKKWYTPTIKLRHSFFKPMLLPLLFVIVITMPYVLNVSMAQFTVFSLIPFIALVVYVPMVGDFDKSTFFIPLRRKFARSKETARIVEVIGLLDELLSYHDYAEKCVHKTALPTMKASTRQEIYLEGAVNPVLGYSDKNYVANDFDASKQNLGFFTGPNSGGKTAFCKTIAQIQLLAQVGCYVPAKAAELTVADRVFYQTPEVNSLDHDVGRFGTELKRTRDIFEKATPSSLVILDELAEGTTHKEKLET
jgi:DNA mismatch repair ATPase MutS